MVPLGLQLNEASRTCAQNKREIIAQLARKVKSERGVSIFRNEKRVHKRAANRETEHGSLLE